MAGTGLKSGKFPILLQFYCSIRYKVETCYFSVAWGGGAELTIHLYYFIQVCYPLIPFSFQGKS